MNVLIVRMNIVQNFYRNIKGHVHITKGKYTFEEFLNYTVIKWKNINFFVHIKLQNRGVYLISPCQYIKIIPFLVEKRAEAAFVVVVVVIVVETYPSFAVA